MGYMAAKKQRSKYDSTFLNYNIREIYWFKVISQLDNGIS
jgi:hypothetical protein